MPSYPQLKAEGSGPAGGVKYSKFAQNLKSVLQTGDEQINNEQINNESPIEAVGSVIGVATSTLQLLNQITEWQGNETNFSF